MSIGVLLISHDASAGNLLRRLEREVDELPLNCAALTLHPGMSAGVLAAHLETRLEKLDTGAGVLVLVDELPAGLQESLQTLATRFPSACVSGLNAALLRHVLQHPGEDLFGLAAQTAHIARAAIQVQTFPTP